MMGRGSGFEVGMVWNRIELMGLFKPTLFKWIRTFSIR